MTAPIVLTWTCACGDQWWVHKRMCEDCGMERPLSLTGLDQFRDNDQRTTWTKAAE